MSVLHGLLKVWIAGGELWAAWMLWGWAGHQPDPTGPPKPPPRPGPRDHDRPRSSPTDPTGQRWPAPPDRRPAQSYITQVMLAKVLSTSFLAQPRSRKVDEG